MLLPEKQKKVVLAISKQESARHPQVTVLPDQRGLIGNSVAKSAWTGGDHRFHPDGMAEPLVTFRKPVLPQTLGMLPVEFELVPLPKKAPAETLGATLELVTAGAAWSTADAVGQALELAGLTIASTPADVLGTALWAAGVDIAGAAAVEGDAVCQR